MTKYLYTKKPFRIRKYKHKDFEPYYLEFNEDKYEIGEDNSMFLIVNNTLFYKTNPSYNDGGDDVKYIYDHFYTPTELRKMKLKKLNDKI